MLSFFKRHYGGEATDDIPKNKLSKLKSRDLDQNSKPESAEYIVVENQPKKGSSKRRFKIWDEENVRFCGMDIFSNKPYKPKPPRNKVKIEYRSSGDVGPGFYYATSSGGYSDGGGYSSGGYCGGDGGGGCGGGGGGGDGGGGGGCGGI